MRLLKNLLWLIIMVLVVGFAILNVNETVTAVNLPGRVSHAPSNIALFAAFAIGMLTAFLLTLAHRLKTRAGSRASSVRIRPEARAGRAAKPAARGPHPEGDRRGRSRMSEFVTVLVVGGLWPASATSPGFSRATPGIAAPPETQYQHGLNSLLAGDHEEALRAFAETVRQDSGNVDAYIHLANLLRERGDAARALQIRRDLTVRAGLSAGQSARSARASYAI
jgi:uncharacterized integral membrane protein